MEVLVAIIAGLIAGFASLIVGLDSVIEMASGAALLWRMRCARVVYSQTAEQKVCRK
jgi:hypothetical protein